MIRVTRRAQQLRPAIYTTVSGALMVAFLSLLPRFSSQLAHTWSAYLADYGPTFPFIVLLACYAAAILMRQCASSPGGDARELRHVLDIAGVIFVLGLLGTYIPFESVLRSGSTDLRHLGQAVASTKLGLTLLICLRVAVLIAERVQRLNLKGED
jgi:hypothetical protein